LTQASEGVRARARSRARRGIRSPRAERPSRLLLQCARAGREASRGLRATGCLRRLVAHHERCCARHGARRAACAGLRLHCSVVKVRRGERHCARRARVQAVLGRSPPLTPQVCGRRSASLRASPCRSLGLRGLAQRVSVGLFLASAVVGAGQACGSYAAGVGARQARIAQASLLHDAVLARASGRACTCGDGASWRTRRLPASGHRSSIPVPVRRARHRQLWRRTSKARCLSGDLDGQCRLTIILGVGASVSRGTSPGEDAPVRRRGCPGRGMPCAPASSKAREERGTAAGSRRREGGSVAPAVFHVERPTAPGRGRSLTPKI
jgi:hypothetical protein